MPVPDEKEHPTMMKLRIEHLWLGLPIFVLIWKGFVYPLPLLDFWWHLRAGEVIYTTRSIPRTDLFSFTAQGKPFILGNWLAEVVYYLINRLGGFPLLILVNTLLLAGTLLFVLLICWEATGRPRLTSFATLAAALSFFVSVRSQVFSFFFFAVFYWILDGFVSKRKSRIWLLPALMIPWVNLHGAFVLGLGLVALFLGLETLRAAAGRSLLSTTEIKKLALVLGICIVATLVNPESYRVYSYVNAVMSDPSSQKLVMEWQPPRIDTTQGAVLFYVPFYLLLIVLVYAGKRPNLTDFGLFLVFSVLGLKATRNSIWFIIIATPIAARYLSTLDPKPVLTALRKTAVLRQLALLFDRPRKEARVQHYGLNLTIACCAIGVLILVSPWVRPGVYGTSLLDPATPVGAMDYIERNALKGNIFHPQIYGDYLVWRLWPNQRCFFDGRVHLYGEPFVRYYHRIFIDSQWEELLKPYGIRYLLLSKSPGQEDSRRLVESARSSPHWRILFEDNISVLFGAVDAVP
jgi:hypothetical protein